MPQVSIIIPTYNHAHFLPYAIESVLQQTFDDWEVIIVDDGSTDDTCAVVAMLEGPRIRYVYQLNRGPNSARNMGLRLARSDLIALLDADDLWGPLYLQTMVARLERSSVGVAVYGGYGFRNEKGVPIGREITKVVPSQACYLELLKGNWLSSSAILLRRSVFREVGDFDETLRASEDFDMWLRIAKRFPVEGERSVLSWVRRYGTNSSNDVNRMADAYIEVLERHLGSLDTPFETWSPIKRSAVAHHYVQHSHMMLANRRVSECANSVAWLIEHQPSAVLTLDAWYTLACVHQGVALLGDIPTWDADRGVADLEALLQELATRLDNVTQLRTIAGLAHLALAKLLYAQGAFSRARSHLRQSATRNPSLSATSDWLELALRLAPGAPAARALVHNKFSWGKDHLRHAPTES